LSAEARKRTGMIENGIPTQAKIALVALALCANQYKGTGVPAENVKKKLAELKKDWKLYVEGDFADLMDVLVSNDLVERKQSKGSKDVYSSKVPRDDILQALDGELKQILGGVKAPRLFGVNMYKPSSAD